MSRRILILNGHPDPSPDRFCGALATAYGDGARQAGHEVRRLDLGSMDFPLIRSAAQFEDSDPPPAIAAAQQDIAWAEHVVIVHPLWLGAAPALLKGFFEQTFRYGFALPRPGPGFPRGLMGGKSARLIVTMGMPQAAYRIIFGAAGVRAEETGILALSGFKPVKKSLIGNVEGMGEKARASWLKRIGDLGGDAE
ncbi:MAG: NAD(P)H-dependent oxidoreductase [Caulobacter sp.]|nr:NAD(P)H-dependent oxidoreductase [Caulobacter sp.]